MKPSIRHIDLNLLLLFDAIYKARNLTIAGERVGLSPSAASHALARLRTIFDEPLFVRLSHGLEPTPFSDALAKKVSVGLVAIRAVFEKPAFEPGMTTRTFRIAMTDIGEQLLLPVLCCHLKEIAPGISIETCHPPARLLHEGMASGEVDFAIGFVPQIRDGIRQKLLHRSAYACVVREGHPDIRDALTLKQYCDASHVVVFAAGTGHGDVIERALEATNVSGQIALRVTHFLAIPAIIMNTNFIATIPRTLAESFHRTLNVRVFVPPIFLPPFDVKQYWHERYHFEPGGRWLRDVIASLNSQVVVRPVRAD